MKGWRVEDEHGREWHAIGYGSNRDTPPEGAEWLEALKLSEIGDRPFHRGVFDTELWIKAGGTKQVEAFDLSRGWSLRQPTIEVQVLLSQSDGRGVVTQVTGDHPVYVPCEAPKEFA